MSDKESDAPSPSLPSLTSQEKLEIAHHCNTFWSYSLNAGGETKYEILHPTNNSVDIQYSRPDSSWRSCAEARLTGEYKSIGRKTSARALSAVNSPLFSGGVALSHHTRRAEAEMAREAQCIIKYQVMAGTFHIQKTELCNCNAKECTCGALYRANKHFVEEVASLLKCLERRKKKLAYYHLAPIFQKYGDVFATKVTVGLAAYYEAGVQRFDSEDVSAFETACETLCRAKVTPTVDVQAQLAIQHGEDKTKQMSREVRWGNCCVIGNVVLREADSPEKLLDHKDEKKNWAAVDLQGFVPITELLPEELAKPCRSVIEKVQNFVDEDLYTKLKGLPAIVVDADVVAALKELQGLAKFERNVNCLLYLGALDKLESLILRPGITSKCLENIIELAEALITAHYDVDAINPTSVEKFLKICQGFLRFKQRNIRILFLRILTHDRVMENFQKSAVYRNLKLVKELYENLKNLKVPYYFLVSHDQYDIYCYHVALLLVFMCRDTNIHDAVGNGVLSFVLHNCSRITRFGEIFVRACSDSSIIAWNFEEKHIQTMVELFQNKSTRDIAVHGLSMLAGKKHDDALVANGIICELTTRLNKMTLPSRTHCLRALELLLPATKRHSDHLQHYNVIVDIILNGEIGDFPLSDVARTLYIFGNITVSDKKLHTIKLTHVYANALCDMINMKSGDERKKYCVTACKLIEKLSRNDSHRQKIVNNAKMIASIFAACSDNDNDIRQTGHSTLHAVITRAGANSSVSPKTRDAIRITTPSTELLKAYINGDEANRGLLLAHFSKYEMDDFSDDMNFRASDFISGILSPPIKDKNAPYVLAILNTILPDPCCEVVDPKAVKYIADMLLNHDDAKPRAETLKAALLLINKTCNEGGLIEPIVEAIGTLLSRDRDNVRIALSLLLNIIQQERYITSLHGILTQLLDCLSNTIDEDIRVNVSSVLLKVIPTTPNGFQLLADYGLTILLIKCIEILDDALKATAVSFIVPSMGDNIAEPHVQMCISMINNALTVGSGELREVVEAWILCLCDLLLHARDMSEEFVLKLLGIVDTYYSSQELQEDNLPIQLETALKNCVSIDGPIRENARAIKQRLFGIDFRSFNWMLDW